MSQRGFERPSKNFIMDLARRSASKLFTIQELTARFRRKWRQEFDSNDFRSALVRLEAHDIVYLFSFGDYVLLQPEILDNHMARLAQVAREQPDGLGYIEAQKARTGDFDQGSLSPLPSKVQAVILQAVVQTSTLR